MKKILKRIVMILCIFFLGFGIVQGLDGITTRNTGHAFKVYRDSNHWHREYDLSVITYQGTTAFCIEPLAFLRPNNPGTLVDFTDWNGLAESNKEQIKLILRYGYIYPGHQTDRYYLATQKMIWEQGNVQVTIYPNRSFSGYYDVSAEENEIKRLISKHDLYPSFNNTSFNLMKDESLELEDTNSVLADFVVDHCSEGITATINGNKLSLHSTTTGEGEVVLRRGNAVANVTTLQAASFSSGQDIVIAPTSSFASEEAKIILNTTGKTDLTIVKKDANTQEVIATEGTQFSLKDEQGNEITNQIDQSKIFTTDAQGMIQLSQLPWGKYTLTEIKAPQGYYLNPEPLSFEISNSEPLTVEFFDYPLTGKVILHKTEKSKQKAVINVSQAHYQLIDTQGYIKGDGYTDEAGNLIFDNLPLGEYTLFEVSAPEGYQIDPTKYPVSIAAGNENVTIEKKVEVQDEKIPLIIKVTKKLEASLFISNQDALENITVGLYADQDFTDYPLNSLIEEYSFDQNGELEVTLPFPGKFYFKETATHPAYQLSSEKYSFEATYQLISPKTITIENSLKRYSFEILKKDSKTNNPLSEAEFTLYQDKEGKIILDKQSSNSSGKVTFANLEAGVYYLKETKAPDNYRPDNTLVKIEVTEDSKLNYLVRTNTHNVKTGDKTNPSWFLLGLVPLSLVFVLRHKMR